jgi:hypothetical protein
MVTISVSSSSLVLQVTSFSFFFNQTTNIYCGMFWKGYSSDINLFVTAVPFLSLPHKKDDMAHESIEKADI